MQQFSFIIFLKFLYKSTLLLYTINIADVMELADVLDSKSSAERRVGSNPTIGTILRLQSLLYSVLQFFIAFFGAILVHFIG